MRAKLATLLVAVLLVALLASACGTPAPPPPPEATTPPEATAPPEATTPPEPPPPEGPSGSIVIVIGGDPSTLDPQYSDDGNEHKINDNVYEHLLTRDPDTGAILPELAESWEQTDDTTWRFNLQENITFHNGEPLNADAVVFSAERIIDPDFNSEQISFVASITGGEAVDEYTVDIFTDGPDPTLPARMTWLKIVPPIYTTEDPDLFEQSPVGTGPYKFVEWARGSHVTLEANADYWGGAPTIGEVTFRPIEEAATRLAALQAGEVDVVTDLIPEYLDQVENSVAIHGLEFPWIRINTNVEPLTDIRVRQALNYAIDKEALAEALYGGYAAVAEGQILTAGHFGYNPDVVAYPYDPDKAMELLDEAGASGATLELIGESGRWLKDKELVEAVATQLEAVGLDIDVNIVEWSDWLDLLFAGAEAAPDLQYSAHDNVLLDADRTLSALFTTDGSQAAYGNPDVDQLVLDGRTETDVDLRQQMYHEAVETIREEAACIFLLNLDNIYGLNPNLEWSPRLDGRIFVKSMTLTE
jgi:peptide/nickel transport system substrate-binding protein